MAILSSHSSSNHTTGTTCNHVVYDIDNISEGKSNGGKSVTEPDTHDDQLDYRPQNQLGLPENQYWGVHFLDVDSNKESNKQGEFLFNYRDGLNWWFNIGDVKYANSGVQVDPVANSSRSNIAVDFFPKSEETVSETYLLIFLDLRWLWGQYFY